MVQLQIQADIFKVIFNEDYFIQFTFMAAKFKKCVLLKYIVS